MSIKKSIVARIRAFWLLFAILALVIVVRIVELKTTDVNELGAKAIQVTSVEQKIPAIRGGIYAKDGALLACSLTRFRLRMDLGAPIADSVFQKDVDSLALCLSQLFGDRSKDSYLKELKNARSRKARYHKLGNRRIGYLEAEKVKRFPIFREGKYKGGLVLERTVLRKHPFGELAKRTLGKLHLNPQKERVGLFGIEDAFESELKGVKGIKEVGRTPRRYEKTLKEAEVGNDVFTTLDIDMQDVAHNALLGQLKKFEAHHGTAIVMEVATGEIKAIVNLEDIGGRRYFERRNFAIEDAVEPGSVFKLPSMIALLEEGAVKPTDSVKTGNGSCKFYGLKMTDSHRLGTITVQDVLEQSSNVGTSLLVHRTFKDNPQKYISRLYDLHLGEPLRLKLKKEARPYIKEPSSKYWYKTSLPWMSVGYEVQVTPLQMLALYNAVANDGKMVKPRLIYSIKNNGKTVRDFSEPIIMDNNICSKSTLTAVRAMLEGVVERGTAKRIKDKRYKIAGKTGTAHIAKATGGYDKENYRASFIGYFPADNPKYSCAVVIDKPNKKIGHYGGQVAAPVLKEIADALYAKGMLKGAKPLQEVLDSVPKKLQTLAGVGEIVNAKDVLGAEFFEGNSEVKDVANMMPNVKGMGLRDALFLLESKGLIVSVKGVGRVAQQSVKAGKNVKKGTKVTLTLL